MKPKKSKPKTKAQAPKAVPLKPVNTGGRDTKCTDVRTQAIADAMKEGLPFERSCIMYGISASTGYNWLKWGDEGKEPYASFLEAVKEAEVEGEMALVKIIKDAARFETKHWTAAAWMLERRFPQRWKKDRNDGDSVSGVVEERKESVNDSIRKALGRAVRDEPGSGEKVTD